MILLFLSHSTGAHSYKLDRRQHAKHRLQQRSSADTFKQRRGVRRLLSRRPLSAIHHQCGTDLAIYGTSQILRTRSRGTRRMSPSPRDGVQYVLLPGYQLHTPEQRTLPPRQRGLPRTAMPNRE
ncbi:hypothetical protein LDENG_00120860 [Lucifuga dentata]|nr:hypothetical protein LDENG_00120860 [Lucifuga dentata]